MQLFFKLSNATTIAAGKKQNCIMLDERIGDAISCALILNYSQLGGHGHGAGQMNGLSKCSSPRSCGKNLGPPMWKHEWAYCFSETRRLAMGGSKIARTRWWDVGGGAADSRRARPTRTRIAAQWRARLRVARNQVRACMGPAVSRRGFVDPEWRARETANAAGPTPARERKPKPIPTWKRGRSSARSGHKGSGSDQGPLLPYSAPAS